MSYVKLDRASHWYRPDGSPAHEVEKADGKGKTNTTIYHARKMGLLPSVTNIIRTMNAPQLDIWKQNQILLHSLTLPRLESESQEDFAKRVVESFKIESNSTKQLGTDIHAATEAYDKGVDYDLSLSTYVQGYAKLLTDLNLTPESIEKRVVAEDYAGTVDRIFTNYFGHRILVDIKTTTIKNKKPPSYDEWLMQLCAYMKAEGNVDGIASLIIDKGNPGDCYLVEYTGDEIERGWRMFEACKDLWKLINKYDPARIAA